MAAQKTMFEMSKAKDQMTEDQALGISIFKGKAQRQEMQHRGKRKTTGAQYQKNRGRRDQIKE